MAKNGTGTVKNPYSWTSSAAALLSFAGAGGQTGACLKDQTFVPRVRMGILAHMYWGLETRSNCQAELGSRRCLLLCACAWLPHGRYRLQKLLCSFVYDFSSSLPFCCRPQLSGVPYLPPSRKLGI